MSMSSYLEAFLTVYGWDMYYVFYLLFASIGFLFYPLMRIVHDIYVSYVSGSEYAGTNYLRQLIASLAMAMMVFFFALVPMKSVDLDSSTVKSVCAEKNDITEHKGKYFNNTETRVPIMPHLAMSIGHGINSVIYSQGTCALDITDVHKGVMAIDLKEADEPQILYGELSRFVSECHNPARSQIKAIMGNKYGDQITLGFKNILKSKVEEIVREKTIWDHDREKHERYLLTNYDSPLIAELLYFDNSPLKMFDETKSIPPLVAASPVAGIIGNGNGSAKQGQETPPSCGEWWSGNNGLRYRLVDAMEKSLAVKVSNDLGTPHCQNDYPWHMTDSRKSLCIEKIKKDLYNGDGDKLAHAMFKSIQGEGATDSVLSGSDSAKLSVVAGAGIGSSILSFVTGKDLSMGLISQATSFYMTVFILKLMLKFLVPMILMAIYMFWAPYMIIGEFRGMTMIKGMILIIAITTMPGLWAIVDHLDDSLFSAMYADGAEGDSYFNMLLLDITTGVFQIGIVFVLFYMINEAGGGNAQGAVNTDQGYSKQAAGGIGSTTGSGLGKNLGQGSRVGGSKFQSWKQNVTSKLNAGRSK